MKWRGKNALTGEREECILKLCGQWSGHALSLSIPFAAILLVCCWCCIFVYQFFKMFLLPFVYAKQKMLASSNFVVQNNLFRSSSAINTLDICTNPIGSDRVFDWFIAEIFCFFLWPTQVFPYSLSHFLCHLFHFEQSEPIYHVLGKVGANRTQQTISR